MLDIQKYIAHTKDGRTFVSETECQSLAEHLTTTARYAKERAAVFGAGEVAELIGLLHDIGKYSDAFQKYIRGGSKAPHAMAGADILNSNYDASTKPCGIIIGSHHVGLCDYGIKADNDNNTYHGKLSNYNAVWLNYGDEIALPNKVAHKCLAPNKDYMAFQVATYLRMLFSVLVDSDFTDTEEYCTNVKRAIDFPQPNELFDKLLDGIPQNSGGKINEIRAKVLKNCLDAGKKPQGLFSLTVPTGGGKTLSSLAFALKHSKERGLRRIIYVIPYTSIIEQNAEVIREILGTDNVLEHHSGIDLEADDFKTRWASENWDIPIVVTTNVQFFESLFANKTTKSRKVHNIANSVVIFDEAQMLPADYLSPCMAAISELVTNYGTTAVLCSATQPLVHKYGYRELECTEIASNPDDLAKQLKRVSYNFVGSKSDVEIIAELSQLKSALLIVNSRRHAFNLYELAAKSFAKEGLFYLSTLLTPQDRSGKIAEIKRRLAKSSPCIVISTQLIEAGVDIDFPVVYRDLGGIDSIIQAGGRANREGKLPGLGEVNVFDATDGPTPLSLQMYSSLGKEVIECLKEKAFELEGVKKYFELLNHALERDEKLDKKGILSEFEMTSRGDVVKMNFETVAKKFKLIENNAHGVVISCSETEGLIRQLRNGGCTRELVRKLQKYSVSIYESEFRRLQNDNALEIIHGVSVLLTAKYYSHESGLDIFGEDNKNAECFWN